jgi:uncharacterized membrane protein YtjA (UPF0391 family)
VRIAAVRSGNLLRKSRKRLRSALARTLEWSGGNPPHSIASENTMLHYALIFFVVALIAAVLGFGGIAGAAAGIAKILFFVFLILFVVSLVMGRRPRV